MKRILAIATLAALAGCAPGAGSQIGTVDIQRIVANWPKFINYNNQLTADAQALERARLPDQQRNTQREALRRRYVELQQEVQSDVQRAASQVAADKHLKLVVTREAIGWGGVDVTPDVEKVLNIIETSPSPKK
jgi:Skp family chaperone for outer membrane proteins